MAAAPRCARHPRGVPEIAAIAVTQVGGSSATSVGQVTEYVLDTHALLWYLQGKRLGKGAIRVLREIDRGRSRGWIPVIVALELALAHERRRSTIGVAELEATILRNPELRLLPLDLRQAKQFALLVGVRDPFDRVVIAAAVTIGCALITADEAIAASGLVHTIWD